MPANRRQSGSQVPRSSGSKRERRQVTTLPSLLRFLRVTAETVDIDEVLTRVVRESARLLGAGSVSVWFLDQERTSLSNVAAKGKVPTARLTVQAAPVIKRALRAGTATVPTARQMTALREYFGAECVLLVPIVTGRQTIGLLVFGYEAWRRFPPDARQLALIAARQAGLAIANATHVKKLDSDRTALTAYRRKRQKLYQVLERFARVRTEADVWQLIPKLACQALEYNYALLEEIKEGQVSAWFVATRKPCAPGFRKVVIERSRQVPGILSKRALAKRRPVVVDDPANDSRVQRSFSKQHFASLVLVPLVLGDQPVGLLHVAAHHGHSPLTPGDLELLSAFGTLCAYVIQNFRLVEDLSEERQNLGAIVRGSADGILSIDADDRIQFFNPAMEDLTGYRQAEAVGQITGELFDPRGEDEGAFDFGWLREKTSRTQVAPVRNATIRTRSGTRRWVGITAAPLPKGQREKQSIVVMRDITEQYDLMRRQREFISITSHELRTPITAIMGFLSLIQNNLDAGGEQIGHFANRAAVASGRLSDLVEDLLSVARLEEGRLKLQLVMARPADLLAEAVTNLQPALSRKRLHYSFVDRLKPMDVIQIDRVKFHQVIVNLLDNAIKYTPGGGGITVTATRTARGVSISVKDTGIGIHPDSLSRIYERFFREHSELSIEAGGTGLGLFITKELVERLGGKLKITSKQGKGTTAVIRFPLHHLQPTGKARSQTKQ